MLDDCDCDGDCGSVADCLFFSHICSYQTVTNLRKLPRSLVHPYNFTDKDLKDNDSRYLLVHGIPLRAKTQGRE